LLSDDQKPKQNVSEEGLDGKFWSKLGEKVLIIKICNTKGSTKRIRFSIVSIMLFST